MKVSHSNTEWSIILAGGEGKRTRPFIQQWLGYSKPKQYCTFVGNRSMLQHTLDRVGKPDHKVTVVAENHLTYARETFDWRQARKVIVQPQNCDTASGFFLSLTYCTGHGPKCHGRHLSIGLFHLSRRSFHGDRSSSNSCDSYAPKPRTPSWHTPHPSRIGLRMGECWQHPRRDREFLPPTSGFVHGKA